MKNSRSFFIAVLFLFVISCSSFATQPFKFAFLTDMHISDSKPVNLIDLEDAINDINTLSDIDFVLVAGDVTDNGDKESFTIARQAFEKLRVPYYISTGNHDTGSGLLGSTNFKSVFGNDKFSFIHKNFRFIGFPTSPVHPGEKAQITDEDLIFIKQQLKSTGRNTPVFLITHYPMLKGDVNNWNELEKKTRKYDIKAILNGHYHRNIVLNYDGIPGIVNRSNQREKKKSSAGYSIYSVSDSLKVYGKMIGQNEQEWLALPLKK